MLTLPVLTKTSKVLSELRYARVWETTYTYTLDLGKSQVSHSFTSAFLELFHHNGFQITSCFKSHIQVNQGTSLCINIRLVTEKKTL